MHPGKYPESEGFQRTITRQGGWVSYGDPFPAGADDMLLPKAGKASGEVDAADAEDVGKVLLGNVNDAALAAARICQEEIQQVAQLNKGTVVFLVGRFIEQKVDIHGKPLYKPGIQKFIAFKHTAEICLCEFQYLHIGQSLGDYRLLDFEILAMISWKNSAAAMEGNDFPMPVFMLHIGPGYAGYDIMDPSERFIRFPQQAAPGKGSFFMGLGEKVFIKLAEIILKQIAWGKHGHPP